MKKAILSIIGIITILFTSTSYAKEDRVLLKNQYYLEEEGIFINLAGDESEYYNVTEELKQRNRELNQNSTQKNEFVQLIEKYKLKLLLADELTENITKQIMISSTQNEVSMQSYNLNNFEYGKLQNFYNDYINNLKKTIQIEESNIIETSNGEVYIYYFTTHEQGQYKIKSYSYFTIMNGKMVTINISFINSELGKEDAELIVDNVSYTYDARYANEKEDDYAVLIAFTSLVALIGMILMKKFVKKKKEYQLSEEEKNQYKKIGGYLAFYIVTVIISIFNAIIGIVKVKSLGIENEIIGALMILQSLASIIINVIILVIIRKKEKISEVGDWIFKLGIINLTLIFLSSCCALASDKVYFKSFYKALIFSEKSGVVYPIIWGTYFRLSKRVKVISDSNKSENGTK